MQTWPNFGFTVAYSGGGGGVDSAITPSITTNRTAASNTGVAPFAVQFNSKSTTAASYTSKPLYELHHLWDFGDTASGVHGYGTKAGVASRNSATGHTAAHVFETPGTYTVNYYAYNPGTGTYNTQTTTITVQDPNTIFSGANTICIANGTLPVAGVNGVPSGATCVNTSSWATVCGYMTAGKRVLLKRGDTWSNATSTAITGTTGIVGAFGTGAKPKITLTAANSHGLYFNGADDWRVMDLEFTATDGGSDAANLNKWSVYGTGCDYTTLLRVEGYNLYDSVFITDADSISIHQCNFHDILHTASGYVVYFERVTKFSTVGTRYSQGWASHCFRISGATDSVFSHSDFEYPGSTRHAFTIRGWGVNTTDSRYNIASDCNFVGGAVSGWVVAIKQNSDTVNDSLRDFLIERCYFLSTSTQGYSQSLMSMVASDFWVRNNIFKEYEASAIAIEYTNTAGAPSPASTYILNNTFWKPDTSIMNKFSAVTLYANTTGTVIKNNLSYAPGMVLDGSGNGSQGTFLLVSGITGSDYTAANNSSDAQQQNTKPWAATTPAAFAEYVPNSYGVNGGITVAIYDDFAGATITGTREIGALQA